MKRLAQFLRSVIPADPWQLLFLIGVVFLFILPVLPWRPDSIMVSTSQLWPNPSMFDISELVMYQSLFSTTLFFTSLVAFFTCFWPGRTPVRRILWGVLVPTALIFVLIVKKYFLVTEPPVSLFRPHNTSWQIFAWLRVNIWEFPTGSYFAVFVLFAIAAFALRLAYGRATLPLSLVARPAAHEEEPDVWARVLQLVFFLLGLVILLRNLAMLPLTLISLRLFGAHAPFGTFPVFEGVNSLIGAAILVGGSLYLLGSAGRRDAIRSLLLPESRSAFFALALPIGVYSSVSIAYYLFDRANWAAYHASLMPPPRVAAYFDLSGLWKASLLFVVFGAFAEELVFRGLLLAKFINRFGIRRGIFVTGMVWAAIHFRSDSYSGLSVDGVLYLLAHRISLCLAMNYVLAWMTLRWKSIIPAAIAHTVSNVLAFGGFTSQIPYSSEFRLIVWGVVALLLFHYWPVAEIGPAEAELSVSPLEPAI
jgi:membrane protease YdiL (CAAX protease family)